MKKFFMVLAAVVAMGFAANAQDNALGLRFGGGNGYGAELSYQHNAGPGFFEFDAGLFDKFVDLTAIYDFNIAPIGPLNFYAGPGVFVATWPGENVLHAGLVGQVGLEYTFNFPLQISLDWRPWFNFVDGFHGYYTGAALGLRYAF
jgi:hypothetical protein